jgi:putative hydrolase of HD superfamily
MEPIAIASGTLGDLTERLIALAVEQGFLAPRAGL